MVAASFLGPASLMTMPVVTTAQPANPPALSLEQQTTLRCAAAFAMVAEGQKRGNAEALAYPALDKRGKEFFVRSSARLMDQTGLDRRAIASIMQREAQDLWDNDQVDQIMPSCLLLLSASGI